MDKQILNGIKFGFGIFLFFSIILGVVYAVGFHSADEILSGNFNGNYTFSGNVNMSSATLSGIGSSIPSGAVMAFNLSSCPSGWSNYTLGEGRVIMGVGTDITSTGGPYNYLLGSLGGNAKHTLSTAEMPSHNHGISYLSNRNGYTGTGTTYTSSNDKETKYFTSQLSGSNGAHENRPAYVALLYCQKD